MANSQNILDYYGKFLPAKGNLASIYYTRFTPGHL
jgi:hypothetical protein